MSDEPEWVQAGYGVNAYEAECRICGTVAELQFGEDEKQYLTPKRKDDTNQDELFAYVFFFVLEKLRRTCDCTEQERQSYERRVFRRENEPSLPNLRFA